MTQKNEFYVQAIWDEEAKIYYSESNIKGLHLETETLDEFYDLAAHFSNELIATNHFGKEVSQEDSVRAVLTPVFFCQPPALDTLPTWQKPKTASELSVPRNIKSRHTANNILKNAGIDKKI